MAKKTADTSPRFRWTGAEVHIPNWIIPNSDSNALEPGREYTASDLPEGFDHPEMLALDSTGNVASTEALVSTESGGEF